MSTFKNKYTGSTTRGHSSYRRDSSTLGKNHIKMLNKTKSTKKRYNLDQKFIKLKEMENEIALPRMKAIIEMEVQNNKASMGQIKQLAIKAFKCYKQGNILLGNGYLLTAFAVLSISIGGDAPRPGGSQIGGPIAIPGLRTAGVADMYQEWRHIDMDVHKLPNGYKQLERKLRRQFRIYENKKKTRRASVLIKPDRRTMIATRKRRLKTR